MEKYVDGARVTGEKTVEFIWKVLLVFGNRNKGKNFGKPLGSESIKGYVAAIVDLWQVHLNSIQLLIIRVKLILNEIMSLLQENISHYNIFLNNYIKNLPVLKTIKQCDAIKINSWVFIQPKNFRIYRVLSCREVESLIFECIWIYWWAISCSFTVKTDWVPN